MLLHKAGIKGKSLDSPEGLEMHVTPLFEQCALLISLSEPDFSTRHISPLHFFKTSCISWASPKLASNTDRGY